MKIVNMNITELNIPERNMRIHTKKQIEEFKRSVTMFGQIRPVVVDETNTILCGNGLYETLLSMEYEKVDVYKIEGLSENQKKKLMMADNKIYGLGIDDIDVFDQFINELKDDLDIPGYDEDILQSMIADAEEITEEVCKYGLVNDDTRQTIQANHERKEEKMAQGISNNDTQSAEPAADQPLNMRISKENISVPDTNTPTTEIQTQEETNRAFVICPDCGCKIWL